MPDLTFTITLNEKQGACLLSVLNRRMADNKKKADACTDPVEAGAIREFASRIEEIIDIIEEA